METTEFIWYNGELVPWSEAKVHVLCHTLHYGGGAFEGIRFYETEQGPAIFRLVAHVRRLIFSANTLKMALNYTEEQICEAILETVRVNKLTSGYIRPLIFYGYGKMGLNPTGSPTDFIIACWPWGAYLSHDRIHIKTSRYIRIHPDSTEVNAKLCGHYVNSMLASLEIQGTQYSEALLLDSSGFISEGPGENFFIIKDGVIYTPKLGTILPGITRETIIMLAKQFGYDVIETNITLAEAYRADEAFFTGTAVEVTPINSIDDNIIGQNEVGPITAKIRTAYQDIVHGKNSSYLSYLSFINNPANSKMAEK
jgi:branched-chain amino acid aminotransferase